jgi:hypothetical protein
MQKEDSHSKQIPPHHIHKHVIRFLHKYHKIRKAKETGRPEWKERWNEWNDANLGWIERFVEHMIPWLVLLLLFILIGEFSSTINVFRWDWLDIFGQFMLRNEHTVGIIDNVIVGFFVADLYFNFFKKKTVWKFIKTSFIDIIAVAPVGFIFRLFGIGVEAQAALHVVATVEKEAAKEGALVEGAIKLEKEAVRLARLEKVAKVAERIPKIARLAHLTQLKKKK